MECVISGFISARGIVADVLFLKVKKCIPEKVDSDGLHSYACYVLESRLDSEHIQIFHPSHTVNCVAKLNSSLRRNVSRHNNMFMCLI